MKGIWSRNHFDVIAAVLRRAVDVSGRLPATQAAGAERALTDVCDAFVAIFNADSERFQPDRFRQAAGLQPKGTTVQLDEREMFFYEHANWAGRFDGESAAHARGRTAILLADAERVFEKAPDTRVEWEPDPPGLTRMNFWVALLYDGRELLGQDDVELTGDPDKDAVRKRVATAILALEYLA
jgi:hypothetical protein